jgi:hypothetical protein
MKSLKNTVIALLLMFALQTNAQDCNDYHEFNCTFADWTYFYSRQSKSALFQKGQTSELRFIAYGGEDYFVSVCTHRKFAPLHFKIYEDNETRDMLYDNSSEEYINTVSFSNNRTRKLIIEVSVPKQGEETLEKRCVGVLIQFKKAEITGEEFDPEKTGF